MDNRDTDEWYPRWGSNSIKRLQDKRESILEEKEDRADRFDVRKRE